MARLHIDVTELAEELSAALEQLARGNEVLLERDGEVVARLVLPGEVPSSRGAASTGGMAAFASGGLQAGADPMGLAMEVLRRAGEMNPAGLDAWDELNREEQFLEMLAEEMTIGEEGLSWSGPKDEEGS